MSFSHRSLLLVVFLMIVGRVCSAVPVASPSFQDLLINPAKPAPTAAKTNMLEAKFNEAQQYQNKGQLDKALNAYKEIDKISPNNPAVLLNMGVIYRAKNTPQTAKTYFLKALSASPNNPAVLFQLAVVSLQLNEKAKAQEYANKLVQQQPKSAQAFLVQGEAYLANNNLSKAKQALKKAHALDAKDPGALYGLVKIASQENNYADILLYGGRVLEKNPKDGQLQMLCAAAAEKLDKRTVAIKHYESASHIAGVQIDALMNLARLYAISGQENKSANSLQRILKLEKRNYEANMLLAHKLYVDNNLAEAEPLFVAAHLAKPDNAEPTIFIALIRTRTNRLDDAFRAAQLAIDSEPKNKSAMEVYAYVQENRKIYSDAIDTYRKWLKLHPEDTVVYSKIAHNLVAMGKPDHALEEYGAAIELHPKDFDLHLEYADLLLSQDSFEKAYEVFEAALALKPGQADAVIGSAVCLQKMERSTEAVGLLEKLVSKDQTNEGARMTLAAIYKEQQMDDLAIEQYKAITAKSPNSIPALLSLVTIYEGQKDYGAAIDIYKKLIQSDPKNTAFAANIARLYAAWGKNDLAVVETNKLLKSDPENVNFRAMLADLYEKQEKPDAALAEYALLAKSNDLSAKAFAYHKSGEIKENQGDLDAAVKFYKNAVGQVPDYGLSLTGLERIYNQQNNAIELQSYLEQLISQAKNNSPYAFYYHLMHIAGNDARAIQVLGDISLANPKIKELHSTLAVAYIDSGDKEKAAEQYKMVLEQDPDDARTNQKLGQIVKAQGKDQEALKYLEKAASQLTFDKQLILDLAQTYDKLNDRPKARNTYKEYLKLDPKNQEVKDRVKELDVVKIEKTDPFK